VVCTSGGVTRLDGARGKKQVWRPRVRTWGLSEANVLYWLQQKSKCSSIASSIMLWMICQTNVLGTTWKCQNVFAADWQHWLSLNSCWNISGVAPLLANPPWLDIYKSNADFENAARQTRQKISYCWKAHLETVIFRMPTHSGVTRVLSQGGANFAKVGP